MKIEQKAQRYNKALKRAKKLYEQGTITESLSYIFPELKESEDERIREEIINYFEHYPNIIVKKERRNDWIAWLEKQGEQKPSDKVKSKFHNSDWVVKGNVIAQILDIQEQYYIGLDINGNDFTSSRFLSDDKIHLWTIQDAKDGDVLVASDGSIFIFKDTIDCTCKHYVALTTDKVVKFNEGLEHYWETSKAVHPATKEQRDLLFQKMKEAGYEWDAELKQLRKIEQKPDWSEEDENRINRLIAYFEDKESFTAEDDIVYANWLKSLKDRVQPKPRQEWSEEEHQIIKDAASVILDCVNTVETKKEEERLEELADKLQNLRSQSQWKPSDAQMASITCAVRKMKESACYDSELVSLFNDLKKLKG